MKADAQTIEALFGREVTYFVPVYQRPYVWNEEDQWGPLWRDLLEVVNARHRRVDGDASQHVPQHFLGAIVLAQRDFGAGSIEIREIIDGQQRLTTIQLLIAAASRVVSESGFPDQAAMLERWIANNEYVAKGVAEKRLKVWPSRSDREAFLRAVQNGEVNGQLAEHRITQAHTFFTEAARGWVESVREKHGDQELESLLDALEVTIRNLLRLVVIDLDKEDKPQVIFETLNARGTPLLAIDLVKNLVFQELHQGDDAEELYDEHWRWLEDGYWREEIRQGRLRRARAEVFLMHWLTMTRVKVIDAQRLYKEFAAMLEFDKGPPVDQLVPGFVSDARLYRSLEEGNVDPVASAFFDSLRMLDTFVVLPLVLFLLRQPPTVLIPERRDKCFAMLESYLVRRMLWRGTTRGYNRFFVENVLAAAVSKPELTDDSILRTLRDADAEATLWPTGQQLDEAILESRAYGTGGIAARRLLAVLWEIERRRLRTGKSENDERPPGLEIEHVMPQSWRKHWPISSSDGSNHELLELERENHVNRLGNMTIVAKKLNPSLSNAAWPTKRKALNKHSVLLMNSRLASENPDVWDEERIDARTRDLLSHIKAIWPGPESITWESSS